MRAFTLLPLLALLAPAALTQSPLHDLHGDAAGDRFGGAVAGVGDVNADGVPDFAVGARHADAAGSNSGGVRVFSGHDGSVLLDLPGGAAGELFGLAVAAADVDGDGHADVIVGAPYADGGALNGGAVRVFSGRDGGLLLARDGGTQFGLFGFAVAGAGDVDGDGLGDVLVGAPQEDGNGADSGVVYVVSLAQATPIFTVAGDAAGDQLGRAVAAAGDVDADGVGDLLVGASGNDAAAPDAGLARVYSGATGAALHTLHGLAAGDELGLAVACAGDVDADGHADVILGAWGSDATGADSGAARVVSGRTGALLHALAGDGAGDRFGWAVAGAGDLDGDGHDDLLVGAPHASARGSRSGLVRAFSGLTGAELFTLHGTDAGDELGSAVAGTGDVNGDGFPELVVGAPLAGPDGVSCGRALLATPIGAPPRTYCTALPNSTGRTAAIGWSGSPRTGLGQLTLHAEGLPRLASALFVHGPQAAQLPLGDGFLCVGPSAGALHRSPPERSDSAGSVAHALDLASAPGPLVPGSTWFFQCWYRDPAALGSGGTGLNLSDGLELTFVP